jgi:hypothetical protein
MVYWVFMSNEFESLHGILKDQTRRKMLLLVNEKGEVKYTDFMEKTGVSSTGTINYHLKILNDLLTKNEAGMYKLTEKGKAACNLMLQFTEKDNAESVAFVKRKWWGLYWRLAVTLAVIGYVFFFINAYLNNYSWVYYFVGAGSIISGLAGLYFFFRFVSPPNPKKPGSTARTIKDISVLGSSLRQVKDEIHSWITTQGIAVEIERDDFVRGHLGNPSGFGLLPPLYFEITIRTELNGINVHTEGWVSMFGVGENNFAENPTLMRVPRKQGWEIISNLWTKLEAISK